MTPTTPTQANLDKAAKAAEIRVGLENPGVSIIARNSILAHAATLDELDRRKAELYALGPQPVVDPLGETWAKMFAVFKNAPNFPEGESAAIAALREFRDREVAAATVAVDAKTAEGAMRKNGLGHLQSGMVLNALHADKLIIIRAPEQANG